MMRARTAFVGAAVALATAGIAIAGLLWMQPPPVAAPAAILATAEVTRGPLRDTKTVTGTLSYGELSTLRPKVEDNVAMVTSIAPVGATIERGQALYALNGQPAILFYGSVPQHRTLRFDAGSTSPVWVELETANAAVEAARLALGLEQARLADAETRIADATLRLDDAVAPAPASAEFVQLGGAIRAAEAKLGRVRELSAAELTPAVEIASAQAELAAARTALDAAVRAVRKEVAGAQLDAATSRVAVATAQGSLAAALTIRDGLAARSSDNSDVRQIADNLAALGYSGPLPEQVRAWQRDADLPVTGIVDPSELIVAPGPVHVAAHKAGVGEMLAASSPEGGAILDYSGVEKLVTVALTVGDQGLAAVGRAAAITLPDKTRVDGTISKVGSVVHDGSIDVTIAIADQAALRNFEVASVDVELVSDSRDDVLSVPIAALLARPQGGFAVEVVSGARSRLVPVDTGLFGAGRVEVSGDGLAEGAQVGVPG